MKRQILLTVGICLLMSSAQAQVQVVYDNGLPDISIGGWASDPSFSRHTGDTFILPNGVNSIGGLEWWGGYCCNGTVSPDQFTLFIYEVTDGTPEVDPVVSVWLEPERTFLDEQVVGVYDHFFYTARFDPITLASQTTYLLSVVNDTTNDITENWFWTVHSNADGSESWARGRPGDAWFAQQYEMAFRILAPVADPRPDVKADGSDGPIVVSVGERVSISASLDAGDWGGEMAELWLGALTPDGVIYFYEGVKLTLSDIPERTLYNGTLGPGLHNLFFILDDKINGMLDFTWFDSVYISVQPSMQDEPSVGHVAEFPDARSELLRNRSLLEQSRLRH